MPTKTVTSEPVDVASRMVAAIAAVHDSKAREQADARARWKRHVAAAAAADGKLPQAAVDEVLQDSTLLGYSPDDFAADVHAVMEDARLAAAITAEQATMSQLANDVAALQSEFNRVQAEYIRVRGERDSIIRALDKTIAERRRDLERKEAEVTKCASRMERARDNQVKFRGRAERRRIFG